MARSSSLLLGLLGLSSLAAVSAGFGCARGELRLSSDAALAGAASTGGDAASGGSTAGGASGGASGGTGGQPCSGLGCPPCDGPDCHEDPGRDCRDGTGACPTCEEDVECPPFAPLCGAGNECRQCRDAQDCIALYGGERPSCWGGWCSSCRSNTDCPFQLTCTAGRCGVCVEDDECPDDFVCRQGTCRPQ